MGIYNWPSHFDSLGFCLVGVIPGFVVKNVHQFISVHQCHFLSIIITNLVFFCKAIVWTKLESDRDICQCGISIKVHALLHISIGTRSFDTECSSSAKYSTRAVKITDYIKKRMITNSTLHYTILKCIVDNGYAPELEELSQMLKRPTEEVKAALYVLQEYHGVVLHPDRPKIWAIHPFSLAPTNLIVKTKSGKEVSYIYFYRSG